MIIAARKRCKHRRDEHAVRDHLQESYDGADKYSQDGACGAKNILIEAADRAENGNNNRKRSRTVLAPLRRAPCDVTCSTEISLNLTNPCELS